MNSHLCLLNMASAAKAKLRQVIVQKVSRDSPLPFSLLGGSERGFGIFIDNVKENSNSTEAGLKRGDQVKWVSQEATAEQQNTVMDVLLSPQRRLYFWCSLFVCMFVCSFVFL